MIYLSKDNMQRALTKVASMHDLVVVCKRDAEAYHQMGCPSVAQHMLTKASKIQSQIQFTERMLLQVVAV